MGLQAEVVLEVMCIMLMRGSVGLLVFGVPGGLIGLIEGMEGLAVLYRYRGGAWWVEGDLCCAMRYSTRLPGSFWDQSNCVSTEEQLEPFSLLLYMLAVSHGLSEVGIGAAYDATVDPSTTPTCLSFLNLKD